MLGGELSAAEEDLRHVPLRWDFMRSRGACGGRLRCRPHTLLALPNFFASRISQTTQNSRTGSAHSRSRRQSSSRTTSRCAASAPSDAGSRSWTLRKTPDSDVMGEVEVQTAIAAWSSQMLAENQVH